MKQIVDAVRFDCGDDGFVNCGGRTRVPTRKGDEVLVGLFGSTKTLTQ
jgi:hypothetical protein